MSSGAPRSCHDDAAYRPLPPPPPPPPPVLECVTDICEGRDQAVLDASPPPPAPTPRPPRRHPTTTGPSSPWSARTRPGGSPPPRWRARPPQATRGAPRDRRGRRRPVRPLEGATVADAVAARDASPWAAERSARPCFHYGPERTLPEMRRGGRETGAGRARGPPTRRPGRAPSAPGLLVAWNLWLVDADLGLARRSPATPRPGCGRSGSPSATRCRSR